MKCNIHKRYKAKLKPRSQCIQCWNIFLESEHANYSSICQEIDRRTLKNIPGVSYVDTSWDFPDENTVMQMLKDKKKEMEMTNEVVS